jgi:hypothetical protein
MANRVGVFGAFDDHDMFVDKLKSKHGWKFGFWELVC